MRATPRSWASGAELIISDTLKPTLHRFSPRFVAPLGPLVVLGVSTVFFGGCGRVGYNLLDGPGAGHDTPVGASGAGGGDGSQDGASGSSSDGVDAAAGGGGGLSEAATGNGGGGGTGDTGGVVSTSDAGDAGDAGDACVVTNGGIERCDGLDNDCNGIEDDGATCGNQCVGATYGGHAYAFCSATHTFADAETDCQSKSMRLARIDDAAENQFLGSLAFAGISNNVVSTWPWFGASDIASPIEWAFVDGTVFWSGRSGGSAVGGLYTNWGSANPGDGSGTYCATLSHSGDLNWVDRGCSNLQPYLCESY